MSGDAVADFQDLLRLFDRHGVRALIVGGMAFIFHAKPRYTKDMDLWIGPATANVEAANHALVEFGSPELLDPDDPREILQIGVEPNRIDLLREMGGFDFELAWKRRIPGSFGSAPANWIDIDTLIAIKSAIDHPRHQEDARILREVKALRERQ